MTPMFDAIVVGAGPGGATTARYLAMMGYEVCLIDKATFPRDKPCGGGFSPIIFKEFPYLAARKDEFLERVLNAGVLHSPSGEITLEGKAKMAVALRSRFDNVLFEVAHDVGAHCMTGKRVKYLSIDGIGVEVVTSSGDTISGRFVVGADGVNSVVARETGLNRSWLQDQITACRVVEVPAEKKEIIDMYGTEGEYHFFANLSGKPGYGWIFPKNETINIGLGIKANHASNMQRTFKSFVKYLAARDLVPSKIEIPSSKGAIVPTGGTIDSFARNRCLLVGDSAGMVNPMTGGGILYAMEAGRIAASIIDDCITKEEYGKNSLEAYQRIWESTNGKDMSSMLLAQKLFTSFLTEVLFRIGAEDQKIQDMVSNAMSESEVASLNVPRLIARSLFVCVKNSLRI
jgi:geranylgeranyl reductase family protein